MNKDKLIALLTDAFDHDPMFVSLFKGEHHRAQMAILFDFLIKRNQHLKGFIFTDDESYVALVDGNESIPLINKLKLMWEMIKLSFKLPFKSLNRLSQYHKAAFSSAPSTPHYYLTLLGVSPNFQGQGLGGQVLYKIHTILPEGKIIALDTENEKNVAYYNRFGYKLINTLEVDDFKIYCMQRKA